MNSAPTDELNRLVDSARQELDEQSPLATDPTKRARQDSFVEHGRWWAEQRRRARTTGRIVTVGALLYLGLFGWILYIFNERIIASGGFDNVSDIALFEAALEVGIGLGVPVALASLAVFLAHRPSFGAQLFARALLWALTLTVGVIQVMLLNVLVSSPSGDETTAVQAHCVLVSNLTCVGALLVLGDHGLRSPARRGFHPAAFQGLLTLSLVMGIADALILLLIGTRFCTAPFHVPVALPLAACLLVSAQGLYRLRTWALAAMAAANLAELLFALNSMLEPLGTYVHVLIATAVVQLLLPVPVYGAIVRGRVPTSSLGDISKKVPALVLIGFGVLGVVQWVALVLV